MLYFLSAKFMAKCELSALRSLINSIVGSVSNLFFSFLSESDLESYLVPNSLPGVKYVFFAVLSAALLAVPPISSSSSSMKVTKKFLVSNPLGTVKFNLVLLWIGRF